MRRIALLGLALATPVWAVELDVIDAGDHTRVVVQNESLRMMVVPEWGGRIMSLVDRASGRELVWAQGSDGGALDDRDDFTMTPYEHTAELRQGNTEAVITLVGEALRGFRITKTLVMVDGRPLIEQRLSIANGSQRPRRFWQRNFLRPGGEALSGDETFFLPTAEGVLADPRMHGRHDDFTRGWTGAIDAETGLGVLLVADLALLEQVYFWRGSDENPTFELVGVEVEPGKQLTSRTWLAVTSGIDAYDDDVVASYVGPAWWREGALQVADLGTWIDLRPKAQPDAAARARGFTLYRTWGENPGAELTDLRFDAPLGGSDSLTVHLAGHVAVQPQVLLTGPGADRFRVLRADDDRNRLLGVEGITLAEGEVRPLQVIFAPGADTGAGEVRAGLVLTGAGGATQTVALTGTVHPVRLPDRRLIWLLPYGGTPYMFTGGPDMTPEAIEGLRFFLNDGTLLGNSVCDIVVNPDQTLTRTLVRGTGLTIREARIQRPELFADLDHLPALDFTYFNPWIHESQLRGFRRAETHAPPFARNTTLALIYEVAGVQLEPGSAEYLKVYEWYIGELLRWMRERGWPEVFIKISDEISPDEVPAFIEMAEVCKRVGYRPYTTITGQVASTPDLLNAMNPVADGWQVQWMSTQTFRDLTHQRFATTTARADITVGSWVAYGNGGAQDTYATRPFEALGINAGDLSDWRLFCDGEELEKIGGAWGNTRRGVATFTPPTLYVSLPDGANPAAGGHALELEYTLRTPDPEGEVLVALDPTDVVSFYAGGSNTYRIPYERARGYGWFAAVNGYPGWGWWAYAHGWHEDSRMVFREEGDEPVRTPCWWGHRDGNQDSDLLVMARGMIRRARETATEAQRAELDALASDLARLVSPERGALVRMEARDYRGRPYYDFPAEGMQAGFREARRQLLSAIAWLKREHPQVDFAPDLYWGETLVLARDAAVDGLLGPDAQAVWREALRVGVSAAREVLPARQGAERDATPGFALAIFEGLPAAEVLAAYGLNVAALELSPTYPPPGDFVTLPGEADGKPCAVIIGGDAEGALLGARCFVKLLEPRW